MGDVRCERFRCEFGRLVGWMDGMDGNMLFGHAVRLSLSGGIVLACF